MEALILALLFGLIPAYIAHKKGRSFYGWWIYGALILIIALPHSLLAKPDVKGMERKQLDEGKRKCPFCAEMIKTEAIVCPHCQRDIGK